ncbi:MAG: TIGR00266 family protein [Vulcanimicrobiota bacterium]
MSLEYRIDYAGSHPMVTILLDSEQSVRVEPGAMIGMSPNIELTSTQPGGLHGLIVKRPDQPERRMRFQMLYTARGGSGQLMLSPGFPGEIYAMELNNHSLLVQSYCLLACDTNLEVDEEVPNGGLFFSPEGRRAEQYLVRVQGTGVLLLSSFGASHLHSLGAGERFLMDTSHVMAFESRIGYQVRQAASELWLRLASAEGLVAEFEGPGEVLVQTRNLSALSDRLRPFQA